MEFNTWCPRLTAAMILSGSAVHVKGFGSALVSARKRLMAAWRSTMGGWSERVMGQKGFASLCFAFAESGRNPLSGSRRSSGCGKGIGLASAWARPGPAAWRFLDDAGRLLALM